MNYSELLAEAIQKDYDLGVCGCLSYQGRILLLQRSDTDNYRDVWEMPGGGIKREEEPRQALVRELNEEAGIKIKVQDLSFVDFFEFHNIENNKHKRKFCFSAELKHPRIKISQEHSNYKFFDKYELENLKTNVLQSDDYQIWTDHYKLAMQMFENL